MLNQIAGALLQTSLETTLLSALVWCFTKVVPRLPALLKVWLWRGVMLRFVLGPFFLFSQGGPQVKENSMAGVLVAIIALMAAVFWVRVALEARAIRALKRTFRSSADEGAVLAVHRLSRLYFLKRSPKLMVSDEIATPMLIGARKPCLVLPAHMNCSDEARDAAIAHELAHLKHADLKWNWLAAVCESMYLFHPAFWVAREELLLAQELASDSSAMEVTRVEKTTYCRMLLAFTKNAAGSNPALSVGLVRTSSHLHQRVLMINLGAGAGLVRPWLAAIILCASLVSPIRRHVENPTTPSPDGPRRASIKVSPAVAGRWEEHPQEVTEK
jgi:hypothetical protein